MACRVNVSSLYLSHVGSYLSSLIILDAVILVYRRNQRILDHILSRLWGRYSRDAIEALLGDQFTELILRLQGCTAL